MARSSPQSTKAPSQRQLRVAEIVRRALTDALQRGELNDPRLEKFTITVPEVRMTPDLKVATAYIMPLGGKGADEVVKLLAQSAKPLRGFVASQVDLKYTPNLRFRVDETFGEASKIDALLRSAQARSDTVQSDVSDAPSDEDGE